MGKFTKVKNRPDRGRTYGSPDVETSFRIWANAHPQRRAKQMAIWQERRRRGK